MTSRGWIRRADGPAAAAVRALRACRAPAAVLLLLGACATATFDPDQPILQRFAEAGRFVPPGMCSFACERGGGVRDIPSLAIDGAYVVSAGRDFEAPNGRGLGRSRTIWIADLGTASADAALRRRLREMEVAQEAIEGVPCWHVFPAEEDTLPLWCASVDDRFLLTALDRDVLAAALQRSTGLATELAPFGSLEFLPADATDLMFLLPPDGAIKDWGLGPPAPTVPMAFAVQPEPWRITMHSRLPPPREYVEWMQDVAMSVDPPAPGDDGWWRSSGVLREESIRSSSFLLVWWVLFGHNIFI